VKKRRIVGRNCARHSTNFSRTKPVDDKVWHAFAEKLFYCIGDLTDDAAYKRLERS